MLIGAGSVRGAVRPFPELAITCVTSRRPADPQQPGLQEGHLRRDREGRDDDRGRQQTVADQEGLGLPPRQAA
jgi:hypothetical protein